MRATVAVMLVVTACLIAAACRGAGSATAPTGPRDTTARADRGEPMMGPFTSLAAYCEPFAREPMPPARYDWSYDYILEDCRVEWGARRPAGPITGAAIVVIGNPFEATCAVAIETDGAWWIDAHPMTCRTYNDIEEPELRVVDVDFTFERDAVTTVIDTTATGMSTHLAGSYEIACARRGGTWRCDAARR